MVMKKPFPTPTQGKNTAEEVSKSKSTVIKEDFPRANTDASLEGANHCSASKDRKARQDFNNRNLKKLAHCSQSHQSWADSTSQCKWQDQKHTAKTTQESHKAVKWNILDWPDQSSDLSLIKRAFHLLKTELYTKKPANKQQGKPPPGKCWKGMAHEETSRVMMSMGSRQPFSAKDSQVWSVKTEPTKHHLFSREHACSNQSLISSIKLLKPRHHPASARDEKMEKDPCLFEIF